MAHPVVNVTAEQAAAAIAGLDPDKVPNVIVFLLDRGGGIQARGLDPQVRQACEATKGQGYEEAYEAYKRATARSMNAFVHKARQLGYTSTSHAYAEG